MWSHDETRLFAVRSVDLRVTSGAWRFAEHHRHDIDAHWTRRTRETPGFFNGTVFVMTTYALAGFELLAAEFVRTDFKSFLYWRETGWRDETVMDAFGSALIFSADERILFGRQNAGNLNSGLCYPPSGFIDAGDVGPDGKIDIDASVVREIVEETGLTPPAISRGRGYVVTIAGPTMSIGVPFLSSLPGSALISAASRHISSDGESELADLVLLEPDDASSGLPMLDYARALLTHLPRPKTLA